jgi:hypothetical protein
MHDSVSTQDMLDKMRQEVYRQFVVKILYDLRKEIVLSNAQLIDGTQGLSADIVSELLGEPIYVATPRTPARRKGDPPKHRPHTRSQVGTLLPSQLSENEPVPKFLERLQVLFDWDDGLARKRWDKYAYRDLAKEAYHQIATALGVESANQWRSSLGCMLLGIFGFFLITIWRRCGLMEVKESRRVMKREANGSGCLVSVSPA